MFLSWSIELDIGEYMGPISLLIVSNQDIGSTIQGQVLLSRDGWLEKEAVQGDRVWHHSRAPVHLWWREESHLFSDHLDEIYCNSTDFEISEVLFLSRHVAASGLPSLTLHAIGVLGVEPFGEQAEHGGRNGQAVPPSPRFASLFRRLNRIAEEHGITDEFDITLETTHHGPLMSTPTLFIEIGSTEKHWGREDAANVWADVLSEEFEFEQSSPTTEINQVVMVGIGGGHYAPRHRSVLLQTNTLVGHILANYSLTMKRPEGDWDPFTGQLPEGPWMNSIDVAIDQTRASFPNHKVVAHLDRKSFKGWQRQSIRRYLESIHVEIFRLADFVNFES
jgi:D-aminoacyl-tRNA deacylase